MMTGKHIKELRDRVGLTQKEFAWLFGVHEMTVSKWERCVLTPNEFQRCFLTALDTAYATPYEYGTLKGLIALLKDPARVWYTILKSYIRELW